MKEGISEVEIDFRFGSLQKQSVVVDNVMIEMIIERTGILDVMKL